MHENNKPALQTTATIILTTTAQQQQQQQQSDLGRGSEHLCIPEVSFSSAPLFLGLAGTTPVGMRAGYHGSTCKKPNTAEIKIEIGLEIKSTNH